MPARTYYVALPFERCAHGTLTPKAVRECANANEALNAAQAFGETHAGALAFSRVIDLDTGRALGARVLAKVGELPNLGYLLS